MNNKYLFKLLYITVHALTYSTVAVSMEAN